ncbi:hypothetical protein, partial [Xanthovirga aplysinae]|uniref:hypothetical protein n=1 Tax=Xanthovirga aplysinae TaxID=2529853 RepID=UPI0024836DD2
MSLKTSTLYYVLMVFIALGACHPKVITSLNKSYAALDYKQEIIIIGLDKIVPEGSELLGEVIIGDTGFSTNCNYEIAIEKAKLEARKAGGNALKIVEHKFPSFWSSSCHRIKAKILRVKDLSVFEQEVREEVAKNLDYAILNIYRFGGTGALLSYDLYLGDTVLCRVKNNFKTTVKINKEGLNSLWSKTE